MTTPQPRADFYCNKCGYFGATKTHSGCSYFAYPVTTPQPRADVCQKLGLGLRQYEPADTMGGQWAHTITLDEYKQAIRVKIAELQGWRFYKHNPSEFRWQIGNRVTTIEHVPDYPNSLDACWEWEVRLNNNEFDVYVEYLEKIRISSGERDRILLTALQRCEAEILRRDK